ncbi:extracellular solute-binding protein [Paenibacillus hexagrammi]|uniref:Extracellular solute-binding protein n=1 Tax=Paenibacillus hexagrammi TaxID=2908839 RepID=A0ABY3SLT8_9BACL|nr:extracellular solute-binding protein [Paenibacillus sp. YPD9-1]UJF34817.1 extracellular solute-binding protein [Paenibacillus sp. YPD9-1]
MGGGQKDKRFYFRIWSSAALLCLAAAVMVSDRLGSDESDNATTRSTPRGELAAPAPSASGFPLTVTPITLHMAGMKTAVLGDWNDMLVFREYEKMTNVKVEFNAIPEELYEDRLKMMLTGSDLPDAFMKGALEPVDVAEYGANGTLIPLEDLIDRYAPNLKKLLHDYPEVRAAAYSADGHIYSIPSIVTLSSALSDKHWINKAWLEKSGLPAPVTTDQLRDVLRAFKNQDMNGNGIADDEIPMTGEDIQQIIDNFSGAFGLQLQMGYALNIEDGHVRIWLTSDRYKLLLQYLAGLYAEGLLDKDIFDSNYKVFFPKITPDRVGVFHNQTDDIFSGYYKHFMALPPWKGPLGDQLKNQRPMARDFGAFAITSANPFPEITMRWIDYFYGKEGSFFFRMGIEGKTYLKQPDGSYTYTDEIKSHPRGLALAAGQYFIWPGRGAPHWN